jgi:hypothetical protein
MYFLVNKGQISVKSNNIYLKKSLKNNQMSNEQVKYPLSNASLPFSLIRNCIENFSVVYKIAQACLNHDLITECILKCDALKNVPENYTKAGRKL